MSEQPRCETCRYYRMEQGPGVVHPGWGACLHEEVDWAVFAPLDRHANGQEFRPHADFGCVLHEPREQDEVEG